MKLIDAHTHLNDDRFKEDFEDVIKRVEEELEFIVNIGFDLESSRESVELSKKYDFIYATIGVHPHDIESYDSSLEKELEKLAEFKKVVAIGEIGLDYYKDYTPRDLQREIFRKQLELAIRLDKPVVIHCREAYKDTIDILQEYKSVRGIFHSYSGSYETAKLLMDRFYFSISGPVTFKNAKNVKEAVRQIPLERLLVETDCPYLTPTPNRGKRNEPIYVKYIAEEIARLKEIDLDEVIKRTNENTKKAYEIKAK